MSDVSIGISSNIPGMSSIKKPSYLIFVEDIFSAKKQIKKFITLDKPELLVGFIQVKGFFCDSSEEEIVKNYQTLLTTVNKDLILEVMIPSDRILYARSLQFKQK